ncbi:MAG: carbohydrate ABC transporter permease [Treponema sp.]|jgi:ABC-type glycerol-3-phosphate transport system permease component|nr:carbohydrate ABC transporter permease [Treponema sp.]
MKENGLKKHVKIIFVIVFCALAVFPFLWMISTSFKPSKEIYTLTPGFIPKDPTLTGYRDMLFNTSQFNMRTWIKNSVIVSAATTLFSLAIATLGGYGMSRFRFRGRAALGYIILMTQVLPGSLLIIPLYVILNNMRLLNKLIALVLAYTTFSVPFCTWMMKSFFDTVPKSLDEAASVEGCDKFRTFYMVILPLTGPGLASTGIFAFIAGWNEYMFASIFMRRYSQWTLPVGIAETAVGQYSTNWTNLMAGGVIIALPIVILFLCLQRYLVSGMTAGAVKQ